MRTPVSTNIYCCQRCFSESGKSWLEVRMILCPRCGNKRCPKAVDHDFLCTGSNEPGQVGVKAVSNMDAHATLSAAAAIIEDARACVAGKAGYEEYMELAQRHREAVNRLHSAQNLIAQHEITIANQAQEIERLRAEVGPEEVSVKPGSVLHHMALRLGLHDYTGFQEPSEQIMRESYGGTSD